MKQNLRLQIEQCKVENEMLKNEIQALKHDRLDKYQSFVSDILRLLQTTSNLLETIHNIITQMGKLCGASSIAIFENTPDGQYINNTFEWCAPGVPATKDRDQNLAYSNFPITKQLYEVHHILKFDRAEQLPKDIRAMYDEKFEHIASLFIQMRPAGTDMGFINVNRYDGKSWNDRDVAFVQQVADVLSTAILRNRTEKALRDSEQKFRTIVQQLNDTIILINEEGTIQYISPGGLRSLGYTNEEMLGQNILALVYPDDVELALAEVQTTLIEHLETDQMPKLVTIRVMNAQGRPIVMEGVGRNAIEDEAVKGVILTFRDVNEQKIAEAKVQANLKQQQLMSRIFQELQYTFNLNESLYSILEWLGDYTKLCAISMKEWLLSGEHSMNTVTWHAPYIAHHYADRLPSQVFEYHQWVKSIQRDLSMVYDYNHLPEFLKMYLRPEMAQRTYAFPIHKSDTPCGIIMFMQCNENESYEWDYNELSFMQSITQIISNALEREAAQTALIKAKERAVESDRLKSAFLANMSHEIRTPMNGIMGFASLLQREATSPQMAQYSHIINDNCQMLLQLLDDIIDISKLESKQMKITQVTCELRPFLQDLSLFYQQILAKRQKKHIEIILDIPKGSETVKVDKIRLQQVLTNLVNNAITFTDKGFIRFGYQRINDKLLFHVMDTGTGIPQAYQGVIFERFRQVDGHYDRNIRGTGLGLAISKNLVEMMGGNIWVESELGVGSSFYFTIAV